MYTRVEQLHSDLTSQCNLSLHRFGKCKQEDNIIMYLLTAAINITQNFVVTKKVKILSNLKLKPTRGKGRKTVLKFNNNMRIIAKQLKGGNDFRERSKKEWKSICTENIFDSYHQTEMSLLIESFHNSIQLGPEYISICCDQLWFK